MAISQVFTWRSSKRLFERAAGARRSSKRSEARRLGALPIVVAGPSGR